LFLIKLTNISFFQRSSVPPSILSVIEDNSENVAPEIRIPTIPPPPPATSNEQ
jgi:hypothetical protein